MAMVHIYMSTVEQLFFCILNLHSNWWVTKYKNYQIVNLNDADALL